MSKKRQLLHSVALVNQQSAGAKSTKMARTRHAKEFIDHCVDSGIDITDSKNITTELVSGYAKYLETATSEKSPNSSGSIHNKMAAVRKLLRKRGVNLEKLGIEKNSGLGIGPRSPGRRWPPR